MVQKYRRSLYRAIIMLLLSIVLLSAAGIGYAWLVLNRQTDSGGTEIQLNGESMSISQYDVYRYNQETDSYENITSKDAEYNLTAYDSIFEERNVNTPLLFAVTVYGFPQDATALSVSFYTDQAKSADPMENYTSNLVYMKAATSSQINSINTDVSLTLSHYTDADDCKVLYEDCIDYFAENGTAEGFVAAKKSGSSYVYDDSVARQNPVVISVPLTAEELEKQEAVIYFIVDYDQELIEAHQIANFSNIQLQIAGKGVDFANDISLITFSSTKD